MVATSNSISTNTTNNSVAIPLDIISRILEQLVEPFPPYNGDCRTLHPIAKRTLYQCLFVTRQVMLESRRALYKYHHFIIKYSEKRLVKFLDYLQQNSTMHFFVRNITLRQVDIGPDAIETILGLPNLTYLHMDDVAIISLDTAESAPLCRIGESAKQAKMAQRKRLKLKHLTLSCASYDIELLELLLAVFGDSLESLKFDSGMEYARSPPPFEEMIREIASDPLMAAFSGQFDGVSNDINRGKIDATLKCIQQYCGRLTRLSILSFHLAVSSIALTEFCAAQKGQQLQANILCRVHDHDHDDFDKTPLFSSLQSLLPNHSLSLIDKDSRLISIEYSPT